MSEVHYQISKKVQEKVDAIETYRKMDQQREEIISRLIMEYQKSNAVKLDELNNWTRKMNNFAVEHQLPIRKLITTEMFNDYMQKLKF